MKLLWTVTHFLFYQFDCIAETANQDQVVFSPPHAVKASIKLFTKSRAEFGSGMIF